ncbi:unnamed protein product [Lactuca saligna]|uniref:Uncharacterized protein n=1 Tax=Lactuca saligna TaxID=75948 RepID=A0AA36E5W9_LACSI|nr:unnamed protein product [Lactuca saligna]
MPVGLSAVLELDDKYASPVHIAADLLSQLSTVMVAYGMELYSELCTVTYEPGNLDVALNFRDILLHSQVLEGITMSMIRGNTCNGADDCCWKGFSIYIMKEEQTILQRLDVATKALHWPIGVHGW